MQRISRTVGAWIMALLAVAGCGGGSDDGGQPSGPPVTISGQITYERVPFDATLGEGLDFSAARPAPARGVIVEAIESGVGGAALAQTTTDAAGDYSLAVPGNRNVFIRARAQMLKTGAAPTWNFAIRNNTNADALYVLDGATFNSGTADSTRNLHAPSGWGGSSYTGTRAAAPFAILDTVYEAKELIVSADADASFPALNLFWSTQNRPAPRFCPDLGNIVTTSYVSFGSPPNNVDSCTPGQVGVDGIYVLGEFAAGDTDEFDAHVIAHEFGHYFEDQLSRSESPGGEHGAGDRLDLRVAFSEGWGNAFAAMVLIDPQYRDSFNGAADDGGFNLETDSAIAEGWFSEFSVGEILWDAFDPANEPGDALALGFDPIFDTLVGPQVTTDAFTSIFSFAAGLRAVAPAEAANLNLLLQGEGVAVTDEFGAAEDDTGGVPGVIPIYQAASFAGPIVFCNRRDAGTTNANKLGNRKFFRLDVPQGGGLVTIQVTGVATPEGVAAVDPDIYVWREGALAAVSISEAQGQEQLSQAPLVAGVHIVEIYDFEIEGALTNRCMSVAFTGL